ncbi:MAG: hypothetical protein IPH74_03540 [Bacteroidetes bacterium]|nr:hypothetical protein [Bacteroidota bacterium]
MGGYIDIAGGKLFNNITVDLPTAGTTIYSGNTTVGLGIATGKTFDLKEGYLLLDGRIDMQGTAKLIIREDNNGYK